MEKYIVLFDGVCNLCSSSVQFILKRDKKNNDYPLFGIEQYQGFDNVATNSLSNK
ncbi:MAG: DUF393 domain-containing protein, partial [Chitinophagaceae bacterium]|nr:DUF393 domain-containing protein [Chitinophagaceae bacterium]